MHLRLLGDILNILAKFNMLRLVTKKRVWEVMLKKHKRLQGWLKIVSLVSYGSYFKCEFPKNICKSLATGRKGRNNGRSSITFRCYGKH